MPLFRITYTDPDDGEEKTVEQAFEDTNYEGRVITAQLWAEDYAYALADKGYYTIKEIKK